MSGSNSSAPGVPPQPTGASAMAASSDDAVVLTVHDMPRAHMTPADAVADSRQRRAGRLKVLLVMLMCAAPVIASYLTYFVIRPEGTTNYSALMSPAREWPANLALTDDAGKPVNPATLRRQWLLVSLGGGACDAACQKRLYTQRQLREMLGRERDRLDKIFIVLDDVVIKPELQAVLNGAPATRVLRAERASLAAWLGVDAKAVDQQLYIVDPMGLWMMRAPVDPEPAKLKRDLDRLMRASSFWDRAGR